MKVFGERCKPPPPGCPGQSLGGVQGLQYIVPKRPKNTFLVHFYLCAAYKLKGKIHLN